MFRSMMLGAAAFAALIGSPIATAVAQDDGFTIRGQRPAIVDESGSMMKMSKLTSSTRVFYGDLNLDTVAGRNELRYRVWLAAKRMCDRLEDLNASNIPLTREDPCLNDAVNMAQSQIYHAVAFGPR